MTYMYCMISTQISGINVLNVSEDEFQHGGTPYSDV